MLKVALHSMAPTPSRTPDGEGALRRSLGISMDLGLFAITDNRVQGSVLDATPTNSHVTSLRSSSSWSRALAHSMQIRWWHMRISSSGLLSMQTPHTSTPGRRFSRSCSCAGSTTRQDRHPPNRPHRWDVSMLTRFKRFDCKECMTTLTMSINMT